MTKLSRKELRRELKEVILPVMKHLRDLVNNGEVPDMFNYEHRGTSLQAQFHASEKGITVYIMYWYDKTIGLKITPEQLSGFLDLSADWLAKEFVNINEELISQVYRSKPTLH